MIDTKIFLENFLQKARFKRINPICLKGRVLDFGGNKAELEPLIDGTYTLVNYDHTPMEGKIFDNIISLAVIEHIPVEEVYNIFNKFSTQLSTSGNIFITTPTPASKPVLEMLASIGLLDKENIKEHKHYWNKKELFDLASASGLEVIAYKRFQFGFNQSCLFRKYPN